ncbi:MAG: hypothetical protein RI998_840 [Pseudomonadota bacterium]|jgi:hypothetical protein
MSQPTQISDEPLPAADPVEPLNEKASDAPESHHEDKPSHLSDPHLEPASSYGRTDPASLMAVQSHELQDPSLNPATADALANPSLTRFVPGGEGVTPDQPAGTPVQPATVGTDLSHWDPHLAHLAQVGLTSADHWEEQIKPRIDQLHEDITQVNEQLDDLEKAKSKPKKS